ncbi:RagB/SusD family nutrient uptake outer membrane protein, partial [Longimicrobium sp.]|uniref:RagB/SusD family nutrient uptake outer membrane protein n=1 Tax=Longimicrobium sp. TaxID=2029185 RepID=UPI002F94A628
VQLGSPETTTAAFERALGHANQGLAAITGTTADDIRVRSALQVTRGRILMNLNRPADAAAAVAGVLTTFTYRTLHSAATERNYIWLRNLQERRYSVGNNEGGNGLNFATAGDPRLPVTASGVRDDQGTPMNRQGLWTAQETPVIIVGGVEARLIEAEAQLRAGGATAALATLNATRRAFFTTAQLPDLAPAGTDAGRVDQLFRERAFWLFGRGHRTGDLRRLIRQYGRPANTVFPTGAWHKNGSQYGTDVTMPNPSAELNNPNVQQLCIDRNA